MKKETAPQASHEIPGHLDEKAVQSILEQFPILEDHGLEYFALPQGGGKKLFIPKRDSIQIDLGDNQRGLARIEDIIEAHIEHPDDSVRDAFKKMGKEFKKVMTIGPGDITKKKPKEKPFRFPWNE